MSMKSFLRCNNGSQVNRLGLTQEIGSAREVGTILLPEPAMVLILWNDFTKSKIQTTMKKF